MKHKKRLLITLILILFFAINHKLLANNLPGYIYDHQNTPLADLKVQLQGCTKYTITDQDGFFSLYFNEQTSQIIEIYCNKKGIGHYYYQHCTEQKPLEILFPIITEIIIFHDNDQHGVIDSFASLQHLVEKSRQKYCSVFLVNSGDIFSGNPIVDQYSPPGYPMIFLMNQLAYDVMTIGNHDFDYGQENLDSLITKANFPILAANIAVEDSILPDFPAYKVLETPNGIEIAFLGLTEVNAETKLPSTLPNNVKGLKFKTGLEAINDFLYLSDSFDLVIILSHQGLNEDQKLAAMLDSGLINLIIGGHSHTPLFQPLIHNNIPIVQAGYNHRYVGKVKLKLHNRDLVKISAGLVDLWSVEEQDQKIKEYINEFNHAFKTEIIGENLTPLSSRAQLGSLMANSIKSSLGLDIAFQNHGGIRLNYLSASEIVNSDIYALEPFGNNIVVFEMSKADLKSLIAYSFTRNNRNRIDLYPAGISYEILFVRSNNTISDISIYCFEGKPLCREKIFSVGLTSYVASTYKFPQKDNGIYLSAKANQLIIQYIQTQQILDYTNLKYTASVSELKQNP